VGLSLPSLRGDHLAGHQCAGPHDRRTVRANLLFAFFICSSVVDPWGWRAVEPHIRFQPNVAICRSAPRVTAATVYRPSAVILGILVASVSTGPRSVFWGWPAVWRSCRSSGPRSLNPAVIVRPRPPLHRRHLSRGAGVVAAQRGEPGPAIVFRRYSQISDGHAGAPCR
jgi:hypothetical protein